MGCLTVPWKGDDGEASVKGFLKSVTSAINTNYMSVHMLLYVHINIYSQIEVAHVVEHSSQEMLF